MGIFSAKSARVMALAALLGITLALIFSRQSSMAGADGGITIWELCASNHGCLTDGKGAHPDWIELTNTGEEAVNLKGFTLGDSKRKLDLAVLPDYMLQPGEYLVLCASGGEGWDGHYYHVPFRLSAQGEFLSLADPSGRILQAIFMPAMGDDESYGISEQGAMVRTAQPTPGAGNQIDGYSGQAAPMGLVEQRR